MKRLLLALTILTTAAACVLALSKGAADAKEQLRAAQSAWQEETQRLAEVQSQQAGLLAQARSLQRESGTWPVQSSVPPALAEFLSSNDVKNASAKMQAELLTALGPGSISSPGYVLVTKESLKNSRLKPLKSAGRAKLTDSVCGVLAITQEERQAVETAFTGAWDRVATWAQANIQRDGPSSNMLVRYTIPADQGFERGSTERLFGETKDAIERAQLLNNYFQHFRLYEDGAIGDRTNILEIYRVSNPPGIKYRGGWAWVGGGEAINTYPEPIPTNGFPAAFSFIFPGGWEEIAEREGFELPPEVKRKD